jgi:hypothetical protein
MTKLEQFIADEKARIELAESVTMPAANMKRLLAIVEKMTWLATEFSKLATVTAPDGRKWPLGVIASDVLAECERIAAGEILKGE